MNGLKSPKGFFFVAILLLFLAGKNILAVNYSKEGLKVISSSESELKLTYTPVILRIDTIMSDNNQITLFPRIAGGSTIYGKKDEPLKVIFNVNVTVPSLTGFELVSSNVLSVKNISGLIAPTPILTHSEDMVGEIYRIDEEAYKKPLAYRNFVELIYSGIARDRYIAELHIEAARYNPSTHSIEIPDKITIDIRFKPDEAILSNNSNNKELFGDFTVNHKVTKNWRIPQNPSFNLKSKVVNDKIQSLSSGKWMKIFINEEGLYLIDAKTLSSIGININPQDIPTIKIFGNGGDNLNEPVSYAKQNIMREQSIIVRSNPDGSLQNIIFYGAPAYGFLSSGWSYNNYYNYYSNTNYYLLTFGGDKGKRATFVEPPQGSVVNSPKIYTNRIFYHEEKNNPFLSGSGKIWFGGTIFPKTLSIQLNNLDRNGSILYRSYLAHRADDTGTFVLKENGHQIASLELMPIYACDAVGNVIEGRSPANFIEQDNISKLVISYNNSSISSTPFFNWLEIHYPRSFVPINNEISFLTDTTLSGITEFTMNPFSGQEIIGYDVTELSNPIPLKNLSSTGGQFVFRDSLFKRIPKHYFISANFKVPHIEFTDFGNYRDTKYNSDIILITHPSLLESANKYKEYREAHSGIKVAIFRTDMIYNEFASGVPDPTAIRDFIAYCYNNWDVKPGYVLLWGDGHYDYKNIQTQAVNFVPPYESYNGLETFFNESSYSNDDFFAMIVGNDLKLDIAIGRIPVDSPENGDWMVEKIKKYETASSLDSWRTVITLMADDSPTSGPMSDWNHDSFTNESENLSKYHISEDFMQKKIYLADYLPENIPNGRRKPAVTTDMLTVINTTGTLFLNWVGHGNPRVWAHEEVLNRDVTIPKMKNIDKLFFNVSATCDFGRFDMPDLKCGAELLLLSKLGGSIGEVASDRAIGESINANLNEGFFNELLNRDNTTGNYRTIGSVYFNTKQKLTYIPTYNLLADPYLTLLIPNYIVNIDSIDGKFIGDLKDTIKIKALTKVNISGTILNPSNMLIDPTFNGTTQITMFDCDQADNAIDIDGTVHHITKFGGVLNRSSAQVVNGKFAASFFIPQDITYQNQAGRINAYAFTNDNRFAKGDNRNFIMDGIDTSNIGLDTKGPDLKIYLDTMTFLPGDYVSDTPLLILDLFDESGINATGNGIGHRIEAWFDDNPVSIDLTDDYCSSLTDSRYGMAKQYIPGLSPGKHKVKARVWDVFDNFSTAETLFRIGDNCQKVIISNINNLPNPFSDVTIFRFLQNLDQVFTARLDIYSIEGRLVKTISEDMNTVHVSEIVWDGTDENSNKVATGAYLYQLTITTTDGKFGRTQGVIAIVR